MHSMELLVLLFISYKMVKEGFARIYTVSVFIIILFQRQSLEGVLHKIFSKNFCKIIKKQPTTCNFFKKETPTQMVFC